MRAVIQAVSSASVRVNGGEPRSIGPGLVILLGVRDTDTLDIVPKLAEKCAGLRIFKDENDKLNLSAKDLGYSALVQLVVFVLENAPARAIFSQFRHDVESIGVLDAQQDDEAGTDGARLAAVDPDAGRGYGLNDCTHISSLLP